MKKRFISAALTLCLCLSSQSVAQASWQEGSLQQGDVLIAEPTPKLNARESAVPSPTEAYQAMIALKEQEAYKEGTTWTDYEPYSDEKGYYHWNGGLIRFPRNRSNVPFFMRGVSNVHSNLAQQ